MRNIAELHQQKYIKQPTSNEGIGQLKTHSHTAVLKEQGRLHIMSTTGSFCWQKL